MYCIIEYTDCQINNAIYCRKVFESKSDAVQYAIELCTEECQRIDMCNMQCLENRQTRNVRIADPVVQFSACHLELAQLAEWRMYMGHYDSTDDVSASRFIVDFGMHRGTPEYAAVSRNFDLDELLMSGGESSDDQKRRLVDLMNYIILGDLCEAICDGRTQVYSDKVYAVVFAPARR